jgi:hypothetical protein
VEQQEQIVSGMKTIRQLAKYMIHEIGNYSQKYKENTRSGADVSRISVQNSNAIQTPRTMPPRKVQENVDQARLA